jgi:hypothetical protein
MLLFEFCMIYGFLGIWNNYMLYECRWREKVYELLVQLKLADIVQKNTESRAKVKVNSIASLCMAACQFKKFSIEKL